MEDQLFTWAGDWEQAGDLVYQHHDCTLVKRIGDFDAGEKFDIICIDYERGIITLFRGETEWKFNLHIGVGSEIRD